MTHTSAPPQAPAAARTVMAMLQRMPHGQLDLHLPGATQPLTFGSATDGTERACLQVHDNRVLARRCAAATLVLPKATLPVNGTVPNWLT